MIDAPTPTLEERMENAKALIRQHQRDIRALERFLHELEELAAKQIAPVGEDVA